MEAYSKLTAVEAALDLLNAVEAAVLHFGILFVGVPEIPLGKLIADAIEEIRKTAEN